MINIIVVGNDMVGFNFCKKFISKPLQEKHQITVFREEPSYV
ncbi:MULTISPECIES: hypothetical protein [unclassified Flavobacterium]|nr:MULTISPECIES: hypothetical protein [unclassified Flavobacterium]NRT16679.1 NAD(P)H-nitrite reductase large subunit [Flavobacterium sp. 28A]